MPQSPEPITVSLLDRDYQFACTPEEQEHLREAARQLDERLRDVKTSAGLVAMDRIAIMAALNLQSELLRTRGLDQRIRLLADEVDNALNSTMD